MLTLDDWYGGYRSWIQRKSSLHDNILTKATLMLSEIGKFGCYVDTATRHRRLARWYVENG